MEIIKKDDGSNIILNLTGKLDSITAPDLENEINNMIVNKKFDVLEIDMTELSYLSSAGLRVLLSVHKKLNAIDSHLKITNANQNIKSVFEITGFLGILDII